MLALSGPLEDHEDVDRLTSHGHVLLEYAQEGLLDQIGAAFGGIKSHRLLSRPSPSTMSTLSSDYLRRATLALLCQVT